MEDAIQPRHKKLVLLVHGIRTAARWQSRIAPQIRDDDTLVETIGYGYFNVFEFLSPFLTRQRAIEQIQWRIQRAIDDNPGRELIIIAHSFGTDCLARILRSTPGLRPSKIIFCGSVIDSNFRWDQLRQQFNILNECGTKDIWPSLARSTTWGYGASGSFGFKTPGITDRFHQMPHSGYFENDFASRYWAPFIRDGIILENKDEVALLEPSWYASLLSLRLLGLPWLGWLAVLLFLLLFMLVSPPRKQLAIVGILPSDSFGPNCREGFMSAFKSNPGIVPVIIDGATLAEMKASRTGAIEDQLKQAFSSYEVLGVVGPPISECAYTVTSFVADLNPHVPVILTSAVSGNDPMWALLRKRIPLYRVGSDISQRAKEVQELLKALLSSNQKVVFLIEGQSEDGPRSFGLRFFDELESAMNFFSHISRDEYERIVFPGRHVEASFDRLENVLSRPDTTVFLLGVDFELKAVIERFFKKSPTFVPRARIIGWMNAHMLNTVFHNGLYHSELVLDISDFRLSHARRFSDIEWQTDVTKRDAMNYFDSTLVLIEAFHLLGEHVPFENSTEYLDRLAAILPTLNTKGIGGPIRFDSTGQNTRSLVFLQYSYERKAWTEITNVDTVVAQK